MSLSARRVLFATDPCREGHDQRRLVPPDVLVRRVEERAAELGGELAAARRRSERLLTVSAGHGFDSVVFGSPDYPVVLSQIPEPPPLLWFVGDRRMLSGVAVALVGSRAASPYAREVAEQLGSDLSDRGVTVVSGLARGVDAAAHRGGLRGVGNTVAVLGCGLDVVYPPEHRDLARRIAECGALVTEHGPAVPPRPFHFPRRNRVISGLSAAVVVIEATERSGSLITARCAADQGRDVMAVPGSVLAGRNGGGHGLIKDGAKVVETADDILEEVGLGGVGAGRLTAEFESDPLLRHMDPGECYDLDALATVSGLSSAELLAHLVDLELSGRILRSGTGWVSLLRG